jgi:hypothetical protein
MKKEELFSAINSISRKVELQKIVRLAELVPNLKELDELLGHNAETALEQLQEQAEGELGDLSDADKIEVRSLLSRVDADSLQIAMKLVEYNFPTNVLLLFHLDRLIMEEGDIPQIKPGLSNIFTSFVKNNPTTHIVFISHDCADVTSILSAALVGSDAINNGQVSMVYESGLGLYLGTAKKEKKDYTAGLRAEISQLMERVALALASTSKSNGFKDKFYFSSTEFSAGIRVHPYARASLGDSLDKDAAMELINCLAIALADLVKEDPKAVHDHAINYFLKKDPNLRTAFNLSSDERVWDMEKIDQYLNDISFVHLGVRGSVIRPSEGTDVQAAQTIIEKIGGEQFIICSADDDLSMPLMQWVSEQQFGLISCSEAAQPNIKSLVEKQGGIELSDLGVVELISIADGYVGISKLTGGK